MVVAYSGAAAGFHGLRPGGQARRPSGPSCAPGRCAPRARDGGAIREAIVTAPSKPLVCRLNIRHAGEWAHTADGDRFIRCRKCLKEKGDGPGWRDLTGG